jgi:phosphatidate cytidylyltransferase
MAVVSPSPSREKSDLYPRVISAIFMAAWGMASAWWGGFAFAITWIVLALVVACEWVMMVRRAEEHRLLWYGLGSLYAIALAGSACILRFADQAGFAAILFVFAVVWSADVCAYFAGRTFGGPKLAPHISPKKTWSGLIGGVLGAIAAALLVLASLGYAISAAHGLVAAILALSSAGGDLFESHLKRLFGVKDSSQLIPGHGGFMDRLDGFVVAACLAAIIGLSRGGVHNVGTGLLVW